jgi:hypothetical protein
VGETEGSSFVQARGPRGLGGCEARCLACLREKLKLPKRGERHAFTTFAERKREGVVQHEDTP